MKKRIVILNEDNHKIEELLKNMEIEVGNIEVYDTTSDDVNIVKNILNKDYETLERIERKLEILGFSAHKIGYKYIIDAILLWDKYHGISNQSLSFIYKKISIKYSKNVYSIEKAIRKCIEYTFTYGNLEELNKIFKTDISVHTGKINNKKFISKMAQCINNKKI